LFSVRAFPHEARRRYGVVKVLADGAYDSRENFNLFDERG
jgi:hypothetical protein